MSTEYNCACVVLVRLAAQYEWLVELGEHVVCVCMSPKELALEWCAAQIRESIHMGVCME